MEKVHCDDIQNSKNCVPQIEYIHNIKQKYKLGSKIGEGSQGKVVEAIDRTNGLKYAVKILSKDKINDDKKLLDQF